MEYLPNITCYYDNDENEGDGMKSGHSFAVTFLSFMELLQIIAHDTGPARPQKPVPLRLSVQPDATASGVSTHCHPMHSEATQNRSSVFIMETFPQPAGPQQRLAVASSSVTAMWPPW